MATILIADDDIYLAGLIKETLKLADPAYEFLEARTGSAVLELVQQEQPDLILLDIMMPGPDGIQICRTLKGDAATRPIPVIFITALQDNDDMIKAVEAGGDDFLSKPFDPLELTLRVQSLLRIKQLHDELRQRYAELEELGRWKDDLTRMIVHDMRTPLASTQLGLQFVLQEGGLKEPYQQTLEIAFSSVVELNNMIVNLLDISRMEQGKLTLHKQPLSLEPVVRAKIKELMPLAHVDDKDFRVQIPQDLPAIPADRALISRIISNLLDNALRYAYEDTDIIVSAKVEPDQDSVKISVHNEGDPIPETQHEAIFEKFKQFGDVAEKRGVGLGLTFCRMAVEAHGGKIWVQSAPNLGTTFHFLLPLGEENSTVHPTWPDR